MPAPLNRVSERLRSCITAGENFQFAATVIVEPLDPPSAGSCAILENLGWLWHDRQSSCRANAAAGYLSAGDKARSARRSAMAPGRACDRLDGRRIDLRQNALEPFHPG